MAPVDQSAPSGWSRVHNKYLAGESKRARHLAAELAMTEHTFATRRGNEHLYVYDPDRAIYDEHGKQSLRELLVARLGLHHTRNEEAEIGAKIKGQTFRESFGAEGIVPAANCDLEIRPGDDPMPLPTKAERAPLARSPASWDEDAEAPRFEEFLANAVPDENERELLQEYAGYGLLIWGLPHHRALFLVGPTASGKSTFLQAVEHIFGKTSNLSPQQMSDQRFGAVELEGAWANVHADIPTELIKNVGLFKQITAGDPIFVERKFEQGYTLKPTAKHLFSANQLPDVSVDDDAFFRRVLLVEFPTTVPREKRDPRLPAKLRDEADGILKWAVEGLQRVLRNGGFKHDRAPHETRRRWEEYSGTIGRFKAARLKVTGDTDDVEAKHEVFSEYCAYCKRIGQSNETKNQLTRKLKEDPKIDDGKRTPDGYEKQVRSYTGVRLKPEDEDE